MSAVVLEKVCKSFGEVLAVQNLNAEIPTGSIYGFLGPNGAGKTTTIRMIMNILCPDSGRISLLDGLTARQARNGIGYMPEERGLYRKMTARDVLMYFGAIKGVTATELTDRVPQWLQRLDLAGWAGKKVEELSRGMNQKLQFAVTAINDPQLLILDEPFSGLDPLNADLLKSIINEMRRDGKTVIFSTHVMHEAENLCDSIILINKGRVILDDNLARIRTQHKSGAVCAELEGDTSFVAGLPMVTAVESRGDKLEITLAKNADTQQLLRALVDQARVTTFEVKVPSLHEIFVSLVGKSDAENS